MSTGSTYPEDRGGGTRRDSFSVSLSVFTLGMIEDFATDVDKQPNVVPSQPCRKPLSAV
jgi:hypothetical protein